jgi:alkylhydroperoxidase family enzyme
VLGEIRRLGFDELDPQLQDALRAKVERLGYLGEFFAVGGHQPAATAAFQHFTEALKKALPAELTEVVALSLASALGNAYEQVQHERLAATQGFSVEWIAAALGHGEPSPLSDEARVARRLALAIVDGYGHHAAAELERAVDVLGEEQAVGVLLTVGRYVAHAVIANTLHLAAPVDGVLTAPGAGPSR